MQAEDVQRLFRSMNILFGSLLTGQVLLLLVSLGIFAGQPLVESSFHDLLKWLVPVLVFTVSIVGLLLAQNRLGRARQLRLLTLKLQAYQVAVIQHIAMLNGACLFCIVSFLLTGEPYYILIYAAVLFLFFRQRPTLAHARLSLGLSDTELPAD
jgi:hypothetical protein